MVNTMISGNVVVGNGALNGYGILFWGGLVMGNEVSNCENGIVIGEPGSVIGNTVNNASSSQTGISVLLLNQAQPYWTRTPSSAPGRTIATPPAPNCAITAAEAPEVSCGQAALP